MVENIAIFTHQIKCISAWHRRHWWNVDRFWPERGYTSRKFDDMFAV